MTNKPRVTAIIVTYHSLGTIAAALDGLRDSYDRGLAEVVVVDNAGSDGTADFVAANYPWVRLVRSPANLGYGRGCNLGFKEVFTPYVLILNPDAIMEPAALRVLADFLDAHSRAGIVAPAIIEGKDSIQAAGLMTTPLSLLKAELGFSKPIPQAKRVMPGSQPFQTPWVCGAIMLIRAELFRKLGGFDPRFFLYFEETDLCRRAVQAGAEIWALGEAVARHAGGVSAKATGKAMTASCISEHYFRSRFYYLVKHFGWLKAIGTESTVYALHWLRRIYHLIAGRQSAVDSIGNRPLLRFPSRPDDAAL